MPLRVAFDLDGVLADFAGAFDRVAGRLFPEPGRRADAASEEANAGNGPPEEPPSRIPLTPRRQRQVWKEIRSTRDFWLTLDPLDPAVVRRIQKCALDNRWEVFFVTQRPATAGDTVQRQTQRWLAGQGFPQPSVIVHSGSRGRLAVALELDYLVDDTIQHCVDAASDSAATAILVAPEEDAAVEAGARRLGIVVCRDAASSLDVLLQAPAGRWTRLLRRARQAIGR